MDMLINKKRKKATIAKKDLRQEKSLCVQNKTRKERGLQREILIELILKKNEIDLKNQMPGQ